MTDRRRRSLTLRTDIDEQVVRAATAAGLTVSAWLTRCVEDRLIVEDGLRAMEEYDLAFGAAPQDVRLSAESEIEAALTTARAAYQAVGPGWVASQA